MKITTVKTLLTETAQRLHAWADRARGKGLIDSDWVIVQQAEKKRDRLDDMLRDKMGLAPFEDLDKEEVVDPVWLQKVDKKFVGEA